MKVWKNLFLKEIAFTTQLLLHTVKDLTEEEALIIPEGFNNNILWNLGHIYSSQELFAFGYANKPVKVPENCKTLFGMGTNPAEWSIQPPTLAELISLLEVQPARIKEQLENSLDEALVAPFSIPGLTLNTSDELLTFSLFHLGGHYQAIKTLIKAIKK